MVVMTNNDVGDDNDDDDDGGGGGGDGDVCDTGVVLVVFASQQFIFNLL